ncbi:zinc finger protein 883 [Drosophila bipectinata]|uniref:zinc finger protein 883 n=1 Tax=Drosophila bipectinata TaxID=42026 RepID=UPI001C89409E|nr:zinc finger protein 774 [Drosophila bipectinata]
MRKLTDAGMAKNCRLCAVPSSILVDLFSTEISNPPVSEMMNSFLKEDCRVKKDELPQKVCPTCLVAAQSAFHFKEKCEQSFHYFTRLTTTGKKADPKAESEPEEIAFEMVGCGDPLSTEVVPECSLETSEIKVCPVQLEACLGVEEDSLLCEITPSDIKQDINLATEEESQNGIEQRDGGLGSDEDNEEDGFSDAWAPEETSSISSEDEEELVIETDIKPNIKAGKSASLLCPLCGAQSKSQRGLAQHMKRHRNHENDPGFPHLCDNCGRGFRTNAKLIIHYRRHTGERPFQCEHCPKAYTHRRTLKMHMLCHDEKNAYNCPECQKTFYKPYHLKAHMQLHSGDKPFKCPDCPMAFNKNSGLKMHSRLHTGERPFKCEICGQGFIQNHHLITHLRVHNEDRPFKCPDCDKSFFEKSNMKKHQRTHSGVKPYKCEECGHEFSHAHHLKNHLRVHTGEKPYKCTQCDKSFAASQSLVKHKIWHEGNRQREFMCTECPKGFDTSHGLKNHQKTHKKPQVKESYQCPHCEVRFALKKTLDKHISTHKIRPFPCPHCPEGFFSGKSYKKHMKLHNLKLEKRTLTS